MTVSKFGLAALCVAALALSACGSSSTRTVTVGTPGGGSTGPGPADPWASSNTDDLTTPAGKLPPLVAATPLREALVVGTARLVGGTGAWVANPDALEIATDPVSYSAAATPLIGQDATGSSVQFPVRSIMLKGNLERGLQQSGEARDPRVAIVQGRHVHASYQDLRSSAVLTGHRCRRLYGGSGGGNCRNAAGNPAAVPQGERTYHPNRVQPKTSIQLSPDGLTIRQGGQGFRYIDTIGDFTQWNDRATICGGTGVEADCLYEDLEISFGRPSADPDGEPNRYWSARLDLKEGRTRDDHLPAVEQARYDERGGTGDYEVWLSNVATGVDLGGDDPEDRYLKYANYGKFSETDKLTSHVRLARIEGLHFGYDADVSTLHGAAASLSATFKGRTMGMVLHPNEAAGVGDRVWVASSTRLRGDVTLYACLGASACSRSASFGNSATGSLASNNVEGEIENLQSRRGAGGWQVYDALRASGGNPPVTLDPAGIDPTGYYYGAAWAALGGQWNVSEYGGQFYGPSSDLETAGWWRLEPDSRQDHHSSAVIGSFGATCTENCN